jgi:hypothetical protein
MVESGNQAIQKIAQKQKRAYEAMIASYAETFTSEHGKKTLSDMRRLYCGSFEGKVGKSLEFAAGQREVVKDIEAKLIAAGRPDFVEKMFEPQTFELFE